MGKFTDEEFEVIVNKYYNALVNIANKYLRDTYESQDVAQDVFQKLYITHKAFESDEHMKNWLIRVTVNHSLDKVRRNKKAPFSSEYIYNLTDKNNNYEHSEIFDCISTLKDNYKKIIMLYYYENYSIKEISAILRINESNVTTRLDRARKKIKSIVLKRREYNDRL